MTIYAENEVSWWMIYMWNDEGGMLRESLARVKLGAHLYVEPWGFHENIVLGGSDRTHWATYRTKFQQNRPREYNSNEGR